jgi:hypothetical protein
MQAVVVAVALQVLLQQPEVLEVGVPALQTLLVLLEHKIPAVVVVDQAAAATLAALVAQVL